MLLNGVVYSKTILRNAFLRYTSKQSKSASAIRASPSVSHEREREKTRHRERERERESRERLIIARDGCRLFHRPVIYGDHSLCPSIPASSQVIVEVSYPSLSHPNCCSLRKIKINKNRQTTQIYTTAVSYNFYMSIRVSVYTHIFLFLFFYLCML